jgi:hypothetical protein
MSTRPQLPAESLMHIGQVAGWAVVLAGLGVALVALVASRLDSRLAQRLRVAIAVLVLAWCLLPADLSPVFWLGLAFQSPSLVGILLGLGLLLRWLVPDFGSSPSHALFPATSVEASKSVLPELASVGMALAGVLLGYALLLDTFAMLPVQLYAWGFGPLAVVAVAAVALLPLVLRSVTGQLPQTAWVLPVAVALFVLTRLPSGNVWDAVLDPLTWLALQAYLLRRVFRALRRSATRA